MNKPLVTLMALVIAVGLVSTVWAGDPIQVSGKHTMSLVKQDTCAIGDSEQHFFTLTNWAGTNASTGSSAFLDGGKVTNVSVSDLVKGNGSNHGYSIVTHDENGVFTRWEGQVMTVMEKDKPYTSFEGKYTWTGGTGAYAGITGTGTYQGHYTSPTTYEVEWNGTYTIGK